MTTATSNPFDIRVTISSPEGIHERLSLPAETITFELAELRLPLSTSVSDCGVSCGGGCRSCASDFLDQN